MSEEFKVKEQGAASLPAAVAEAHQTLADTRGFILLSLDEDGVQSVVGCSALDLVTLALTFARVTELSLAAMLESSGSSTKH